MKIYMEVMEAVNKQVKKGLDKYGKTVSQAELSPSEWIDHAVEEAIDNVFYLLALRQSLKPGAANEHFNCGNCKFLGCAVDIEPCVGCVDAKNFQPLHKEDK